MSFTSFLLEGEIKLPQGLFRRASDEVVRYVLSYVIEQLSGAKQEAYVEVRERLVKRLAARQLKPAKIAAMRSVIKLNIDLSDLPKRYLDHLQKHRIDPPTTVDLVIQWAGSNSETRLGTFGYYKHSAEKPKLWLNVKETKVGKYAWGRYAGGSSLPIHIAGATKLAAVHELLDKVDDTLEHLLTALEHEIVHLVQHVTLPIHDTIDASRSSDHRLYYTSEIEFDPQIRSAVLRYMDQERLNDDAGAPGSRDSWSRAFVAAGPDVGFAKPDVFFKHLRAHSEPKWKRAVKLFAARLQRKYPRFD